MKNKNRKKNMEPELITKKPKRRFLKFIIKWIFIFFIIFLIFFTKNLFKIKSLVQNMIPYQNSIVVDSNGNIIATLGIEKRQESTQINQIPENLKNAYIAIEDKRFYSHHGVDVKRTSAAVISYVLHRGNASFGGSSITQQFVKNLTGDNESSVSRKVSEWFRAWQVELFMDKEEILESYFNIIYVGPNIYGVSMGAKYYFNKNINELDLAECAFLAGINNAPNAYNPYTDKDNSEKIKKRTKTVLTAMKEQGYINDTQYNEAIEKVNNGFKFEKSLAIKETDSKVYSYHTDALINELIEDISSRKNISKNFAKNYIYESGFKIYSTENIEIQDIVEKECKKSIYILNSKKNPNATSQAAVVIIDQISGKVLACSGGLGDKTVSRGLNRATQTLRQTGSAGKPIAVLAPAIKDKLITPATIFSDEQTTFEDGEDGYTPVDYNGFQGDITVRRAVESSQNIPFVKIMEQVTPKKSIQFMEQLGITTLTDVDDNINLALGGLDKGISPLEMAGAYATIANNGYYIEPTFYTKIENRTGENIFVSKQKKRKVFSDEVAYILKDLLKQPVEGANGTAQYCKIEGIDVAAKTGTTNDNYDRWLCGFTNYYTAVVWYGYDLNETIERNGHNPAGQMWASIMKQLHKDKENSQFSKPSKISTMAVCKETGCLANPTCKETYTEVFIKGTEPNQCTKH